MSDVTLMLKKEDVELFKEFQKNYNFIKAKLEQITRSESEVIRICRSLSPYERLIIEADKGGNKNLFVIIRSTRQEIGENETVFIRTGNEMSGFNSVAQ
jgi:hypothetical protein